MPLDFVALGHVGVLHHHRQLTPFPASLFPWSQKNAPKQPWSLKSCKTGCGVWVS